MDVAGDLWYFTPELSGSCPRERELLCCVHWKLCEIRCSHSSRESRKHSGSHKWYITFNFYFFFVNTYLSYLWHLQKISSKEETLLPDVACLNENTNYLYFFFSSSWIQVIICKTVTWHTATSINLFKRRFDLNTAFLNHVSTQAYTSMLSMKLIVVKRTKQVLSVPCTDLSNNEYCFKERLQKIWQTWNLLVWVKSHQEHWLWIKTCCCVERIKILAELKSPLLFYICFHNFWRTEGHRGEFSCHERKFYMKTKYIWNCLKDPIMKHNFEYVAKEFCNFQYSFSNICCRKYFFPGYQGIGCHHLCWPFSLIHRAMNSAGAFFCDAFTEVSDSYLTSVCIYCCRILSWVMGH